jgi:hypothetical protein
MSSYNKIFQSLINECFINITWTRPECDIISFANRNYGGYDVGRFERLRMFILAHKYPKRVIAVILDLSETFTCTEKGLMYDSALINEIYDDLNDGRLYHHYKLQQYFFV